jgi:predicted phosphodiesterase
VAEETIVVLSDLHANARALRRGIEVARAGRVDRWVVLGDLLTYGCDIDEVLDLVDELRDVAGAVVLRGNHDQLYMDLAANERGYYRRLPDWLRESVDYTVERLDLAGFMRRYDWRDEFPLGGILFSHASPFGAGDWRYLNDEQDLADAAECLLTRGFRIGVFGHVHRHRSLLLHDTGGGEYGDGDTVNEASSRAVITAGSLGQPRDTGRVASILKLHVDGAKCRSEFVPVEYDVAAHVAGIRASSMSDATKLKLCEFFARS